VSDDLVCAHFSLARSCLVCELEAEIADAHRAQRDAENELSKALAGQEMAEAEVRRLQAELAEARREIRSLSVFATETLENDERYRWLRNNYASVGFDGRELIWDEPDPGGVLDDAIDAARKETP
jgi:hypothetical protein